MRRKQANVPSRMLPRARAERSVARRGLRHCVLLTTPFFLPSLINREIETPWNGYEAPSLGGAATPNEAEPRIPSSRPRQGSRRHFLRRIAFFGTFTEARKSHGSLRSIAWDEGSRESVDTESQSLRLAGQPVGEPAHAAAPPAPGTGVQGPGTRSRPAALHS